MVQQITATDYIKSVLKERFKVAVFVGCGPIVTYTDGQFKLEIKFSPTDKYYMQISRNNRPWTSDLSTAEQVLCKAIRNYLDETNYQKP